MAKRYTLSVHDMSRKKLCELYDSTIMSEGEPYDIEHVDPIDGLKSITFTLPRTVNGKENWRAAYMTNDYLLRWGVDGEFDWFVIDEPEDAHTGRKDVIAVSASHIASLLNRKNLYGSFDDTNGIDTCGNLIAKALTGTGWALGECDTFYEADGTTEKIRSYTCNEKTGAYSMIAGICDLFVAYPTFNGDEKTVDIHALANHDGMMEVVFGKNLDSIQRTRTSTELITRLYVEGDYTQNQYVGIDDVNPTGLPFILNFDYYRETGQFTAEHETALNDYLAAMSSAQAAIKTAAEAEQAALTQLATIWGSSDFVLYSVSGGTPTYVMKSLGATDENAELAEGDKLAAVQSNGTYSYVTLPASKKLATNIAWAVKFLGPVAGTMGAREVSVEAKTTTLDTLTKAIAAADTQTERDQLTSEKAAQQASINTLNTERYAQMLQCITLAQSIGGYMNTIAAQQALQEQAELTFDAAMGDMLKDGAWNDKNYVAGQEESLYADALVVAAEMSRPQYEYSLSVLDLSTLTGHKGEEFKKNQKIRVYDEATGINDIAYVSEKRTKPRLENRNSITLSTDETGVALKSFDTLINRIMTQADLVKENQGIYERARALSGDGTLAAARLDGEIDLLKNKMASTASGIYTDDSGNMIIEAADGSSAMMLTGAGFMLAAGKDNDGNWEWRTFGTGNGFTADMITTGILKAGIITILGSDQFYWDANNIYIFEPGTNGQHQIRIGQYDGTNYGIGFTRDGGQTWQNAISFNGVTLSASDQQTLTQLSSDVSGLQTSVSNVEGNVTTLQQDVSGLTTRVADAEGDISTLEQTASGLTTRVTDAEGDISALEQTASGLATRVTDAEGNITTLQQTASSLEATVGDENSGLVAQMAAVPGQIAAAVGDIEIGGTNLLKGTGRGTSSFTVRNVAGGTVTTYDFKNLQQNVRRYTASGAVTNLIVMTFPTYIKLVAGTEYTLSTHMATYSKAGAFRFFYSDDGITYTDDYNSRGEIKAVEGVQSLTYTFTATSSVYIMVGLIIPSMASGTYVDVYDQWKLEVGNKATSWGLCPIDPATELINGTTIIMTKDQMTFRGPVINLDVSGDSGDTRWDESGMTIPSINSPSVAVRYDGPSTITVNPSVTPDGVSTFRTLTDALAILSHKTIDQAIQITLATNTTENNAVLEGVSGATPGTNPEIRIYGGDSASAAKTLNGHLIVTDCVPKLRFWGLNVACASGDAVTVTRAYVQIGSYDSVTATNGYALHATEGGKIRAVGTALNGKTCGRADYGGWLLMGNTKGAGSTYSVDATDGGIICLYGTIPTGTKHRANGGILQDDSSGTSGGGGTTPTSTTTVSASLTSTRTYQSGGSGWLTNTDTIQQGLNAGYRHFAVIQFSTSGWSGKTIASGELTLHRLSGGKGAAITVKLMTTTSAAGSGTPTGTYTSYDVIGTIDRNETATFSIPAAALQEIANGTRTSLMLYDNGSDWGGRGYSENYAVFSGSGSSTSSYRPQLSVTYNT